MWDYKTAFLPPENMHKQIQEWSKEDYRISHLVPLADDGQLFLVMEKYIEEEQKDLTPYRTSEPNESAISPKKGGIDGFV